ncbi:max-like protein X isoform X2 [Hydra vulgaris]|uniref:max-like protein X isoform X2 n=1 Tax=Hydra vulgaris TaxID=6087 RepID=UPI001F5FA099|nr:max-like protein X isoform X2 [Hydra vulgaris]
MALKIIGFQDHDVKSNKTYKHKIFIGEQDYCTEKQDSSFNHHGPLQKNAHCAAEQKRRDAIKDGLVQLAKLVQQNHCEEDFKASKAQILQKAITCVNVLVEEQGHRTREIEDLEKHLTVLKMIQGSYEDLAKSVHVSHKNEINDEMKFAVFKYLMAILWESFNLTVIITDFSCLTSTVIAWIQAHCKPDIIRSNLVKSIRSVLGFS